MVVPWKAISIFVTILLFFGGGLFTAIRWLLNQYVRQLQQRLETFDKSLSGVEEKLDRSIKDLDEKFEMKMEVIENKMEQREVRLDRVKEELKDFKLQVAKEYVEHDDWVRVEGGQNVYLQRISDQISQLATAIGAQEAASAGESDIPFPSEAQP